MAAQNLHLSKLELGKDVLRIIGAATPTDGTSGTGHGTAGPGSLYFCTGTPGVYINTNTKASPAWKVVTHA